MGKTWVTAGKARFIVKDSTFKIKIVIMLRKKEEHLKIMIGFLK